MQNYKAVGNILFPEFSGIRVNMMPFILGDAQSIPNYMREYSEMISKAEFSGRDGETAYLTIDEKIVDPNTSQRRGGVHTEAGSSRFGGSEFGGSSPKFGGGGQFGSDSSLRWGGGWGGNRVDAGVYMANNQEGTCQIWNESIEPRLNGHVEIDDLKTQPELVRANTLYWMHDKTPHEALVSKGGPRQFFRVVSPDVGAWYRKESTENPLGVRPNCPIVETKFAA